MSKFEFASATELKPHDRLSFRTAILGIGISYAFAVVMFLILAAAVTFTAFPETAVSVSITVITAISIMLSGMVATRRVRTKGWLAGAVEGMIYTAVLYAAGGIFGNGLGMGLGTISMFASGVVFGAFGGIIGINIRKN